MEKRFEFVSFHDTHEDKPEMDIPVQETPGKTDDKKRPDMSIPGEDINLEIVPVDHDDTGKNEAPGRPEIIREDIIDEIEDEEREEEEREREINEIIRKRDNPSWEN